MRIQILTSALEDLSKARKFYERQGYDLGAYFMDTLFSEIDSLTLYGGVHRQVFGYHRMLSKRFPYAIYYRVTEDTVKVYRVLDCRQHPNRIRDALS